jgi:hypothetical protein
MYFLLPYSLAELTDICFLISFGDTYNIDELPEPKVSNVHTLPHTYLLTPWHYSHDGHKPPLIRFHSLMFSVFEEQVANLLPQHHFVSA